MVDRPGYNGTSEYKTRSKDEAYGQFTYACVHGGMLQQGDKYFGWSNSHPTGCSYDDDQTVDVWLHRSTVSNDNKGISEMMNDRRIVTIGMAFYIGDGPKGVDYYKPRADVFINEPLGKFIIDIRGGPIMVLPQMQYVKNTDLPGDFGQAQIATISLQTHKVDKSQDLKDAEVVIVTRNTKDIKLDVTSQLKVADG